MKKLRLLLFEECDRNCAGCCNKDWDLASLPVETQFYQYDEIILTGGEPMLNMRLVLTTIEAIRLQNKTAKIFLYTAKTDEPLDLLAMMKYIDGITITLHNQSDLEPFLLFNELLNVENKSLRLNIFDEVNLLCFNGVIDTIVSSIWEVRKNMKWIKDSCLPDDEVFKRLK